MILWSGWFRKVKIIKFRLKFVPKDKRYIKVFVFPNFKTMYKFYELQLEKTGQTNEYKTDFFGMFQPFEIINFSKSKKGIKNNWTGNLLLCGKRLGVGVVAHECGHACLHYYSLCKGNMNIKTLQDQEDLLIPLYNLVKEFWNKFYKYNV